MKSSILLLLAACMAYAATAQNVGIGTTSPDASAQLDINSTTRGVLVPRMNMTQRDAITTPATGLLIFQTDNTPGFYYYNGTAWTAISGSGSTGWLLTGNAATDSLTHFVGTTDNQPLVFRINNFRAGFLGNSGNVFWGKGSGTGNTTGYSNVGAGIEALKNNTDRSNLVAIGDSALYTNGVGATASFQGTNNTAVGSKSLYKNTKGYNNTANKYNALYQNVTGIRNTANGANALYSNITGNENTANGANALYSNLFGNNNLANGYNALYSNLFGDNNVANGYHTLYSNTSGYENTANGAYALYYNTTGNSNTADGVAALNRNTTGNQNTATGHAALAGNTTGLGNTAAGHWSLFNNTEGGSNTASGMVSLFSNTTGNNNTAIGNGADVTSGGLSNATAIGSGAKVDISNKVRIGNTSVTVIEGQVSFSFPSDARFKYNINNSVPGLDFIIKLKPVTYYFDTEKLDHYSKTGEISNSIVRSVAYTKPIQLHTGFVAQDVEKIAKELGYDFDGLHIPQNNRDHYSLAYSQFVMPLVKAVQEQQEMIQQQQKQSENQMELITQLQKELQQLKEKMK